MVRPQEPGWDWSQNETWRHALFASASPLAVPRRESIVFDAPFMRRPLAGRRPTAMGTPDPDGGTKPIDPWHFLLLVDIGNFAVLRRHLGAPRADCLVLDVADRAAELLPQARLAVVGRTMIELRFEGGERSDLNRAAADLGQLFAPPLTLDGEQHQVELLIAGAAAPCAALDDVRLVEEAEAALATARCEQRTVLHEVGERDGGFDRVSLIRDLSRAVDRGELFLQYQPKVHLRRQEIRSVEALVRWQHPTRGLVLPGHFITVAEEARLIGPITLWTLERAIADQRQLAENGHDLMVFVNISGQLLADAAFVARACQMVQGAGNKIGLEITETSVIRDPQTAIGHLKIFADMGITIAIDDYGAGLSSLAYLKQLPARELKIDKMFVMQLTSSNRDPLIVRSTIDLAHAMEMEVTAEGVETPAALALLSVMGCDMAQGFLISRPIGMAALIQFLNEKQHLNMVADPRDAFNRGASFWKSA
jgi:diguanylate cyclase